MCCEENIIDNKLIKVDEIDVDLLTRRECVYV